MFKVITLLILTLYTLPLSAQVNPNLCANARAKTNVIKTETGQQEVSFVDYKKVKKIFKKLKKSKYKIPYLAHQGNNESCRFRAHKIAKILNDEFNIKSLKAFVEAKELKDENGDTVYNADGSIPIEDPLMFTSSKTGETYAWADHTANALCVKHSGKTKLFVIDLALFDKPVEHNTWVNALTDNRGKSYYGRSYLTTMYNLSRTHEDYPEIANAFSPYEINLTEEDLESRLAEHNEILELLKKDSDPIKKRSINSVKSIKTYRKKICKKSKKYKKKICY